MPISPYTSVCFTLLIVSLAVLVVGAVGGGWWQALLAGIIVAPFVTLLAAIVHWLTDCVVHTVGRAGSKLRSQGWV